MSSPRKSDMCTYVSALFTRRMRATFSYRIGHLCLLTKLLCWLRTTPICYRTCIPMSPGTLTALYLFTGQAS